MKQLTDHYRFGIQLAIASFVLGTLLLIIYYFTLAGMVILTGLIYTGIAITINLLYTGILVYHSIQKKITSRLAFRTIGVLMLNIPIAILYFLGVIALWDYARITLYNTTAHDLTFINVTGCEQKEIKSLEKGDAQTLWIRIPHDCSIEIEYEIEGIKKTETVIRYLTNMGGLKGTYKIGSGKEIQEDL